MFSHVNNPIYAFGYSDINTADCTGSEFPCHKYVPIIKIILNPPSTPLRFYQQRAKTAIFQLRMSAREIGSVVDQDRTLAQKYVEYRVDEADPVASRDYWEHIMCGGL